LLSTGPGAGAEEEGEDMAAGGGLEEACFLWVWEEGEAGREDGRVRRETGREGEEGGRRRRLDKRLTLLLVRARYVRKTPTSEYKATF
jgi:hypothetical protein